MNPKRVAGWIFRYINQERKKRGLKKLKSDKILINEAIRLAMNERGTIHYATKNQRHRDVARRIVNDWLNNPNQRATILNKRYTHMGIGVHIYWDIGRKEYKIYVAKRFKSENKRNNKIRKKKNNNLTKFIRNFKLKK
ncbi:hypothetical protein JH146_0404 [Methanocaldococcus bathoardescens]|uniref:SCP domain-containing protein n=1 Tax=Methanocaldococcus bathoardescens TaxID=1301915 RepID=A0A076LIA7_9EURY|nr:CAP domain-containing protein [Methanocaldococcus bathoardescens]AIJ05254.1 hypothetical protein JH146_0404 [Methanocaldococcus bathoardescens]